MTKDRDVMKKELKKVARERDDLVNRCTDQSSNYSKNNSSLFKLFIVSLTLGIIQMNRPTPNFACQLLNRIVPISADDIAC